MLEVEKGDIWLRDGRERWTYYKVTHVTPCMAVLAECDRRGRKKPGGRGRTVRKSTMSAWLLVGMNGKTSSSTGSHF